MEMTIKQIVRDYLLGSEYDGLYDPNCECGCEINDLFPCDDVCPDCVAGYKISCTCGQGCPYHIASKKEEENDNN